MTQLDIVRQQVDAFNAASPFTKERVAADMLNSLLAFLADLDNRVRALEHPHDASRGRLKTWGRAGGRPL